MVPWVSSQSSSVTTKKFMDKMLSNRLLYFSPEYSEMKEIPQINKISERETTQFLLK